MYYLLLLFIKIYILSNSLASSMSSSYSSFVSFKGDLYMKKVFKVSGIFYSFLNKNLKVLSRTDVSLVFSE